MSELIFVLLSLAAGVAALIAVSLVNRKQTRDRMLAIHLNQVKRKIDELEELGVSLESILESSAIPRAINEEIIDSIQQLGPLKKDAQMFEICLNNALERKELLLDPRNKVELYRVQESDSGIARQHHYIREARNALNQRRAKGTISVEEMDAFQDELSWADMMVEITTHLAQGHKSLVRNDLLKAIAFYKRAQQIAAGTIVNDSRKSQLVKELNELLKKQRKYLSPELMPETQFNPDGGEGEQYHNKNTSHAGGDSDATEEESTEGFSLKSETSLASGQP